MAGPYHWFSNCWGYGWNGCCWDACCDPVIDCCTAVGPIMGAPDAVVPVAPGPALGPTPAPAAPLNEPAATPPTPAPAPQPSPNSDYVPPAPSAHGPKALLLPTRENSGLLTIWVPADAKVLVNGFVTCSTGSKREYVSHNLKPGFTYKYEVCAQIVREGKLLEETRVVFLTAGAKEGVAFGFNPKPPVEVATVW